MRLGKITSVLLIAITLLAVGALAGQLRQPAPAGAADNSGAMLQQLRIMNSKLDVQTAQLIKIRTNIGDYSETGSGLRSEMKDELTKICLAIQGIPDDNYFYCV